MSKAIVAITLLSVLAVANAQYIPWADPFARNVTAESIVVQNCGGQSPRLFASSGGCWEQTSGQPDVTITSYTVSSSKFPCTSGNSATTLTVKLSAPLNAGKCSVTCEGFGCSDGEVQVCGADFGIQNCPVQPSANPYTFVGKSGSCSAGFGDYTITIACPQYTYVSYINF